MTDAPSEGERQFDPSNLLDGLRSIKAAESSFGSARQDRRIPSLVFHPDQPIRRHRNPLRRANAAVYVCRNPADVDIAFLTAQCNSRRFQAWGLHDPERRADCCRQPCLCHG